VRLPHRRDDEFPAIRKKASLSVAPSQLYPNAKAPVIPADPESDRRFF